MIARLRLLPRNARGGVVGEFAMVAPVLFMLIMALAELCYQSYVQSVLTGAVQKAGRDSTIQGNDAQSAAIDGKVQQMVQTIAPNATFSSTRANFDNFASMAGEPFTDSKYPNDNTGTFDGICNHGETYVDVNGNGRYDLDLSQSGEGGASDVSRYTMTVTYNRLFPLTAAIGMGTTATLSATTLLKNQPYATQNVNSGTNTKTCS